GSILLWKFNKENKKEAKKEAFCLFRGLTKDDLAGSPEKIFTIFANATYEFERWEEKNTLTSFSDICKEKERAFEVLKEELKDFCRKRINKGQGKCNLGMGECRGDDECCFNDEDCPGDHANGFRYTYDANGDGKETWLKCRKVDRFGYKVCCPEDATEEQCEAAHEAWIMSKDEKEEKIGEKIIKAMMEKLESKIKK
ncbi:MAG: hypothetical protein DRP03_03130, partial [Candidatus Aenigmatarchaeota archaeon]